MYKRVRTAEGNDGKETETASEGQQLESNRTTKGSSREQRAESKERGAVYLLALRFLESGYILHGGHGFIEVLQTHGSRQQVRPDLPFVTLVLERLPGET
jgi:hypothetical protein